MERDLQTLVSTRPRATAFAVLGGLAGLASLVITLGVHAPARLTAQVDAGRAEKPLRVFLPLEGGRLTEASGQPLAPGKTRISFALYDSPEGGPAVLAPKEDDVEVGPGGLVRTAVIAVDANGLSDVDFSRPLYLGVWARGGPEARPRTPILPATFARKSEKAEDAANAERLGGRTWDERAEVVRGLIGEKSRDGVPVGTVLAFAGPQEVIPTADGWLFCDGRALQVDDYRDLYRVIGHAHGGGGGTFHLPDYRGLFLRGIDSGSGRDPEAGTREEPDRKGTAGDRVGSYQHFATGRPQGERKDFTTKLAGGHNHDNGSFNRLLRFDKLDTESGGLDTRIGNSEEPNLADSGPIKAVEDHAHGILGGDVETRPVNSSVIYMIKSVRH